MGPHPAIVALLATIALTGVNVQRAAPTGRGLDDNRRVLDLRFGAFSNLSAPAVLASLQPARAERTDDRRRSKDAARDCVSEASGKDFTTVRGPRGMERSRRDQCRHHLDGTVHHEKVERVVVKRVAGAHK